MLMHRDMANTNDEDDAINLSDLRALGSEPFTPLSERIAARQAELGTGLQNLRRLLPANEFDRYIESLVALRLQDGTVWLTTDRAVHRSIVERNYLGAIRTAFGVQKVRVISQA